MLVGKARGEGGKRKKQKILNNTVRKNGKERRRMNEEGNSKIEARRGEKEKKDQKGRG